MSNITDNSSGLRMPRPSPNIQHRPRHRLRKPRLAKKPKPLSFSHLWKRKISRLFTHLNQNLQLTIRDRIKRSGLPHVPSLTMLSHSDRFSLSSSPSSRRILRLTNALPDDLSSGSTIPSISSSDVPIMLSLNETGYCHVPRRQDPNKSEDSHVSQDMKVEKDEEAFTNLLADNVDRNHSHGPEHVAQEASRPRGPRGTRSLFVSHTPMSDAPADNGRLQLFMQFERFRNPQVKLSSRPRQVAWPSLELRQGDISPAEISPSQAPNRKYSNIRLKQRRRLIRVGFYDCRILQASNLYVFNPSLDELISTAKSILCENDRPSDSKGTSSESAQMFNSIHLHYPDCASRLPFVFTDPNGNYEKYKAQLGRNWELILQQHHMICHGLDLWIGVGTGECSHECVGGDSGVGPAEKVKVIS
ncbi:hypothetical protein HD806DRAFT_549460 [Xylariaceae sp. AK1471]|nr:hypothetical protein HD806DRAFT_549460 [Xylariaceae sp. AK1471]